VIQGYRLGIRAPLHNPATDSVRHTKQIGPFEDVANRRQRAFAEHDGAASDERLVPRQDANRPSLADAGGTARQCHLREWQRAPLGEEAEQS
jgi:hypothetical protein